MIDLEAIRYRRLGLALESTSANRSAALTMGEVGIDIDVLLAEVERLRDDAEMPIPITIVCSVHGQLDRSCDCLRTLSAIYLGTRVAAWESDRVPQEPK